MRAASGLLKDFTADIQGATAIEYALIAGGICLVIIVGVDMVGAALVGLFSNVASLF